MSNKELIDIISAYSKSESSYLKKISNKTRNDLEEILKNLIVVTINDKNSSSLREMITTTMAGYNTNESKIGYDGYKLVNGEKSSFVEVKPKNIYTKSDGSLSAKLNGAGNFTDFRWEKFKRIKNDNIDMLVSGFSHGKIIYIIKFKFNSPSFLKKLEFQLKKRFPDGKDVKGQWLRSATFGFNDYKNSKSIEIIYVSKDIKKHKSEITTNLFDFLIESY